MPSTEGAQAAPMGVSWTDAAPIPRAAVFDLELELVLLDLELADARNAELEREADLLGDAWLKTLVYSSDLEHENHTLRAEVARLKYELSRYNAAYGLGDD